jgi:hypothetical protein
MRRRLGKGRALKKIRLRARHGSDEDIYSRRLLLDHTQMEGPRLRLVLPLVVVAASDSPIYRCCNLARGSVGS